MRGMFKMLRLHQIQGDVSSRISIEQGPQDIQWLHISFLRFEELSDQYSSQFKTIDSFKMNKEMAALWLRIWRGSFADDGRFSGWSVSINLFLWRQWIEIRQILQAFIIKIRFNFHQIHHLFDEMNRKLAINQKIEEQLSTKSVVLSLFEIWPEINEREIWKNSKFQKRRNLNVSKIQLCNSRCVLYDSICYLSFLEMNEDWGNQNQNREMLPENDEPSLHTCPILQWHDIWMIFGVGWCSSWVKFIKWGKWFGLSKWNQVIPSFLNEYHVQLWREVSSWFGFDGWSLDLPLKLPDRSIDRICFSEWGIFEKVAKSKVDGLIRWSMWKMRKKNLIALKVPRSGFASLQPSFRLQTDERLACGSIDLRLSASFSCVLWSPEGTPGDDLVFWAFWRSPCACFWLCMFFRCCWECWLTLSLSLTSFACSECDSLFFQQNFRIFFQAIFFKKKR